MSRHGTHLASVLFGRPDGPVPGLAPGRRGLIVPSFAEEEGHRSQRDRARALDPAVEAGAQVSKVSGGPKAPYQRGGGSPGPGRPGTPATRTC